MYFNGSIFAAFFVPKFHVHILEFIFVIIHVFLDTIVTVIFSANVLSKNYLIHVSAKSRR